MNMTRLTGDGAESNVCLKGFVGRKLKRLTREGIEPYVCLRNEEGGKVEVEPLGTKTYGLDFSKLWSEVEEEIPKRADACLTVSVEHMGDGVYAHTVEYYKITKEQEFKTQLRSIYNPR